MKKSLAMLVAVILVLMMSTSAALATSFSIANMQCTNPDDLDVKYSTSWSERKYLDNQRIYVAHSVAGSSLGATNMLHGVRRTDGVGSVLAGKKWVVPTGGGGIPIQSNAFYASGIINYTYTIAGRGNTDYYTIEGRTTISISGNFYVNQ